MKYSYVENNFTINIRNPLFWVEHGDKPDHVSKKYKCMHA